MQYLPIVYFLTAAGRLKRSSIPILHVLAITLRAFHNQNLLDYLLTSVRPASLHSHFRAF